MAENIYISKFVIFYTPHFKVCKKEYNYVFFIINNKYIYSCFTIKRFIKNIRKYEILHYILCKNMIYMYFIRIDLRNKKQKVVVELSILQNIKYIRS